MDLCEMERFSYGIGVTDQEMCLGFDYRHPVRHPVPVSPGTVIPLPIPSTRYRHPVLDDGYRITVDFWCGTG